MKVLTAKFIKKIKRTDTVTSFRFACEEKLSFIPGQFLRLIFDEEHLGSAGLNKYLSFSSSPAKDYVEVTKRLSASSFSRKLAALSAGDRVLLRAPLGHCVLRREDKKIVFLIGGIGITPVISILEHVVDNDLDVDIVLFYSNKSVEDIAFKPELDSWLRLKPKIKIFYTLTGAPAAGRGFIPGVINKDLLNAKLKDLGARTVFIFGPPGMVESMEGVCRDLGCPAAQVRTESFIGY